MVLCFNSSMSVVANEYLSNSALKKLYDSFLYKYHYNPPITNLNKLLKDILIDELKLKINEKNFNYCILNELLKIVKNWFAAAKPESTFYFDFVCSLRANLRFLESYESAKDKLDLCMSDNNRENKLCVFKKNAHLDGPDAGGNSNGRYVMFVDCKLNAIKNMKIDHSNLPSVTIEIGKSIGWIHPPLTVKQLLNWPYIGFLLDLPDLNITHYASPIYTRYLHFADCEEVLDYDKENCLELMQVYDAKVTRICNVETLTTYLCLLKQVIDNLNEISNQRKEELTCIMEVIIRDITQCKTKFCDLGIDSSYFGSKYKYIRYYNVTNDSSNDQEIPDTLKTKKMKTLSNEQPQDKYDKIVEIMAPMFKFNVNSCSFWDKSGREKLLKYFQDMLTIKDVDKITKFIKEINKCVTYMCSYCNTICSNESAFFKMEQHIQEVHGYENPWKCTNCDCYFDSFDLATYNWGHNCKDCTNKIN